MAARPSPRAVLRQAQGQLSAFLTGQGLKQTRQRDTILKEFVSAKGHLTVEDLYERVRERNPEIGAATVYRTLKLFCEAGIASPIHFQAGVTLYEYRSAHHDHLICVGCGEIVEFECSMIEQSQLDIAAEYGYRLVNHRHDLYGFCAKCNKLEANH